MPTGHSLTLCWGFHNEFFGDGWYLRLNMAATKKVFPQFHYFPMRAGSAANQDVLSDPKRHFVMLNDISDKDVMEIKRILQDRKVVSPHSEDVHTGTTVWLFTAIVHGALSEFLSEEVKHGILNSEVFSAVTGLTG